MRIIVSESIKEFRMKSRHNLHHSLPGRRVERSIDVDDNNYRLTFSHSRQTKDRVIMGKGESLIIQMIPR